MVEDKILIPLSEVKIRGLNSVVIDYRQPRPDQITTEEAEYALKDPTQQVTFMQVKGGIWISECGIYVTDQEIFNRDFLNLDVVRTKYKVLPNGEVIVFEEIQSGIFNPRCIPGRRVEAAVTNERPNPPVLGYLEISSKPSLASRALSTLLRC